MRGEYFRSFFATERDQAGRVRTYLRAACDLFDRACGWDLASMAVMLVVDLLSFMLLVAWLVSQWYAAVPVVLPLPIMEVTFRVQADVLK